MTRITPVVLILALICASPARAQGTVTTPLADSAARSAIGREATVTGVVVQVKDHAHHGFAYLNFGGRFPDMTFSVLIPDSALARFGDLKRFEGHRATATGTVWLQDGRTPAMTLTDPATLVLIP